MTDFHRNEWGYPQFSAGEWARRDALAEEVMERENLAGLIVYGRPGGGALMAWLAHYTPPNPAWLARARGGGPESDILNLHFYNHIGCTKAFARPREVRCYHPDPAAAVARALDDLGAVRGRVGIAGLRSAIPHGQFEAIKKAAPEAEFVDVERDLLRLWRIPSEEELGWYRESGRQTDLTCAALERAIRPGLSEFDLSRIVHEGYLSEGGQMGIHFISSGPMAGEGRGVPWQFFTGRRLERGDAVITEITISWWGYRTQIHRPFAVAAPPNDLYQRLFDAAYECYERVRAIVKPGATTREILEAADIIAERGFFQHDSLFHGPQGRSPEIGTQDSNHTFEDYTLQENEIVIVQPNPTTPDGAAGLQLGAAMIVRPSGGESLHRYPFHFPVCGA